MTVEEQIQALKEHNLAINIWMCDGVAAYEKPHGGYFMILWIVEDTPTTCYNPGYITVIIGGHEYSRALNEEWNNVPQALLKEFEHCDLSDILMADTTEWGDLICEAVYGINVDIDDCYYLDHDKCPYDTNVCERVTTPIYDFIKVDY